MTDTPEPCGCLTRHGISGEPSHVISYCPTHDDAFEMKAELAERERLLEDAMGDRAALLAALERIADRSWDEATVDGRNVAEMVHVARAAIAEAKGDEDIFAGRRNALQEKWAKRAKGEVRA